MSSEKPWHKHHFTAMVSRPISCVVCSQPEEHENHEGSKNPKQGIATALNRPDWRVYADDPVSRSIRGLPVTGGDPNPGHPDRNGARRTQRPSSERSLPGVQHGGARAASADAREGEARSELSPELPRPFPVAEIDHSVYRELTDD